jgi:hypothetical protein
MELQLCCVIVGWPMRMGMTVMSAGFGESWRASQKLRCVTFEQLEINFIIIMDRENKILLFINIQVFVNTLASLVTGILFLFISFCE